MDKLEKAVKDGSHSEYHKLLSNIEKKRNKMLHVAEKRRSLAEINILNFFNSQKNAAFSQFYVGSFIIIIIIVHVYKQLIFFIMFI